MAFKAVTTNQGESTTPSVAVPAGAAIGDIVVLELQSDNTSWTALAPTNFTNFAVIPTTGDSGVFAACWKRLSAADTGSYAWPTQSVTTPWTAAAYLFDGRHASNNPTFTQAVQNTPAASPVSVAAGSITATDADDLLWLGCMDVTVQNAGNGFAPPGSFTERVDMENATATPGWCNMSGATRDNVVAGATGTITGTGTLASGTAGWAAFLVRIPAADTTPTSTLPADDFNSDTIDRGLWVDNRGPVAVEDGSALIPCRAGTGCSFSTTNNLNLTGTQAFGRFPAFPQTAGVTSWFILAINPITSGNDYNSFLAFVKDGTNLILRKAAGFVNDDTTITFDATNHKWWRIRESGGSVFWDTAPDAAGDPTRPGTWTQRRTMANPFAVTALRLELKCNYNGAALQHELFECSTLNTVDTATPLQQMRGRNTLKPARFMYAIGSATTLADIQAAAPNIDHLILQAGRWDWGDAAKVVNPKVKVYMYKDAAGISTATGLDRLGGTTPIGGVGKPQADAIGVNAYLHATSLGGVGSHPTSIMEFSDFPGNYLANIGHASYYDAWAANVIAELKQGMWDGVFMDDMNPAVENHWAPGPGDVAEYPSDALYADAFNIFMLNTTTRIRNAGFLTVGNFGPFWGGGYVDRMDMMNRWAGDYLDISMDEFWIKWRDTTVHAPAQILEQIANLRHVMSRDKMFLAVLPGQLGAAWDPQFRLAMAGGLLVAKGYDRFLSHYDNTDMAYNDAMVTHPEQTPDLGAPLGRYSQVVSGQFVRLFEKGEVHLNISGSSKTATFAKPVYGSGLTASSSTSLATNAGLIVTYNPQPLVNAATGIGSGSIGGGSLGIRESLGTAYSRGTADVAAAIDTLARLAARLRSTADVAAAADTTARVAARPRATADVAPAADTTARAAARPRATADAAPAADTVADATAFVRAVTDLAKAADALTRAGTQSRPLTDLAPAADATARALAAARAMTDLAHVGEVVTRSATVTRLLADVAAAADTAARASARARATADVAAASDSPTGVKVILRGTADVAAAADAITAAIAARVRGALDAAPATDTVNRQTVATRTLADASPASDSLAALAGQSRSTGDLAHAHDATTRATTTARAATDAAPAADATARQGVIARALSDLAHVAETVARVVGRPRAITDAAPAADADTRAVTQARSLADLAHVHDTVIGATGAFVSISDAAPAADAVLRLTVAARSTADAAHAADTLIKAYGAARATQDTAHAAEALTRAVTLARALQDLAHAADALARAAVVVRATTDNAHAAEAASRVVAAARTVTDLAAAADVLIAGQARARSTADVAHAHDSLAFTTGKGANVNDVAHAHDTTARTHVALRGTSDAAAVAESLARLAQATRGLADVAHAADATTRSAAVSEAVGDTAHAADAAADAYSAVRATADAAHAADAVTRNLVLTIVVPDDAPAQDNGYRAYSTSRATQDAAPASDTTVGTLAGAFQRELRARVRRSYVWARRVTPEPVRVTVRRAVAWARRVDD